MTTVTPTFKPGDLVHVEHEWTSFDGPVLSHDPATALVFVLQPDNQVYAADQKHVAPVSVPLYRVVQYLFQVGPWVAHILSRSVEVNGLPAKDGDQRLHLNDRVTYEWYDRGFDSDELKTITLTPDLYERAKF